MHCIPKLPVTKKKILFFTFSLLVRLLCEKLLNSIPMLHFARTFKYLLRHHCNLSSSLILCDITCDFPFFFTVFSFFSNHSSVLICLEKCWGFGFYRLIGRTNILKYIHSVICMCVLLYINIYVEKSLLKLFSNTLFTVLHIGSMNRTLN